MMAREQTLHLLFGSGYYFSINITQLGLFIGGCNPVSHVFRVTKKPGPPHVPYIRFQNDFVVTVDCCDCEREPLIFWPSGLAC